MAKKAVTTSPTSSDVKPLHVEYRPKDWKEVVGQDLAVKTLARLIAGRKSQAFILTGPSGTGKTTLARIAAIAWGCDESGIAEIDAATKSGIDNVRDIQDLTRYKAFGGEGGRAIIIDECHGLSRQSWDALLKVIEEPSSHVVWFFCTTNPGKVPATIKTRCSLITLKSVSVKALTILCDDVCRLEKIDVDEEVLDYIIDNCNGSPRQMLVDLELCREVRSLKEAKELLRQAVESDGVLELCRFLFRPGSWSKAMVIVAKIKDESHEGTRIQIMNYYGAVARNAKSDRDAIHALSIIGAFAKPYNQSEGIAPLMLSLGDCLFSRD